MDDLEKELFETTIKPAILEDTLFETTTAPAIIVTSTTKKSTVVTTTIVPNITTESTTKKMDEIPQDTTVGPKNVSELTTIPFHDETTSSSLISEPREILPDTTISPEDDLEDKVFGTPEKDLETELFDTTIMPDVSQSTTEKAKTGKFFLKRNHLHC